jgi:hypothetical protein
MKEEDVAVVGVPLITPLDELRERPLGNAPLDTLHVMGVDPELIRVCEYDVPTIPADIGEVVVIDGAVEEIVPIAACTAAKRGCCGLCVGR